MPTLMTQGNSEGTRRGDATCHKAKKPECACICGGRYHGCAADGSPPPRCLEDAEMKIQGIDPSTVDSAVRLRITEDVLRRVGAPADSIVRLFWRQTDLFSEHGVPVPAEGP